jgi:hypothetical protein
VQAALNESIESDLGDPEQQRPALRRTSARGNHVLVLFEEAELVRLLVDQELGVATSSIFTHRVI